MRRLEEAPRVRQLRHNSANNRRSLIGKNVQEERRLEWSQHRQLRFDDAFQSAFCRLGFGKPLRNCLLKAFNRSFPKPHVSTVRSETQIRISKSVISAAA